MTTTDPVRRVQLSDDFYRRRIATIQAALDAEQIDGLLLVDTYDVIYACGFMHVPSERPLGLYIPKTGAPALFVPLLEKENAADTWIGDVRTYFEYPGEEHPTVWMARESGARRLGIDALSHELYIRLSHSGVEVVPTALVEHLRWVKAPEELSLIRQAASYADFCLEYVYTHAADLIRGGGTELDILSACLSATAAKMQDELGDVFELKVGSVVGTVHSGPRAALPHGRPLERKPQPGETLIAGIGATVGGYHAESGATFILGEPTADQMHCLRASVACNDAGAAALRVGATCASVNEAALGALHDAGLSAFIRHRIGHGMGLEGHESPWLAPGDSTVLVANMVFSNEPGIYRPGIDGYRIINSMIVTEGMAEIPSRFLTEHPPEGRVITI